MYCLHNSKYISSSLCGIRIFSVFVSGWWAMRSIYTLLHDRNYHIIYGMLYLCGYEVCADYLLEYLMKGRSSWRGTFAFSTYSNTPHSSPMTSMKIKHLPIGMTACWNRVHRMNYISRNSFNFEIVSWINSPKFQKEKTENAINQSVLQRAEYCRYHQLHAHPTQSASAYEYIIIIDIYCSLSFLLSPIIFSTVCSPTCTCTISRIWNSLSCCPMETTWEGNSWNRLLAYSYYHNHDGLCWPCALTNNRICYALCVAQIYHKYHHHIMNNLCVHENRQYCLLRLCLFAKENCISVQAVCGKLCSEKRPPFRRGRVYLIFNHLQTCPCCLYKIHSVGAK